MEEESVLGAESGGEGAAKGVEEIGGRAGVAVGPLGVGAEVKRVGEAVGRNRPTLGDTGRGRQGGGLEIQEPLEQGGDHLVIGRRVDDVRIEFARFAGVADLQGRGAEADVDGGLAFGTGG